MKGTKKFLSVVLVLLLVIGLVACNKGEKKESKPKVVAEKVTGVDIPTFAIMINGVKVDNTMMASYPVYSVIADSVNSVGTPSTSTYVGYAMTDVLKAAGLTKKYVWLEGTADDGYTVTIAGKTVTEPTTLLAVIKDGKQFKTAPWLAPCSSLISGDYLKNMVSILVNIKEGRPEGIDNTMKADVAVPEGAPELADRTDKVKFSDFSFKVNGKDVTNKTLKSLRIYKVSVNVVNKKGVASEATYTGYKLVDVLKACGVSKYSTVKVVANDGYESELTAEQSSSEYTIVAIEKDKETGEGGSIWIAPCLETSAGAYVKLVVEIIAQ